MCTTTYQPWNILSFLFIYLYTAQLFTLNYHKVTAFPYRSGQILGQRLKNTKSSSFHKLLKSDIWIFKPIIPHRGNNREAGPYPSHPHVLYHFLQSTCRLRKRREQSRYQVNHNSWNPRTWSVPEQRRLGLAIGVACFSFVSLLCWKRQSSI